MADLFANRLIDGRTEDFSEVPTKLKSSVADLLLSQYNRPDLVPIEYGGTK